MSNNGLPFNENLSSLANRDNAQSYLSDGTYYILVKWANVLSGKQTQGLTEYDLWCIIAKIKTGRSVYGYDLYSIIKSISDNITGSSNGGSIYDLITKAVNFDPTPPPPSTPTLFQIIITGQSNGKASNSVPILTQDTNSKVLMFFGGLIPGSTGLDSLAPLVEDTGESVCSAMGRELVHLIGSNHMFLFSNVSVDGARYTQLKKGTTPYADSIAQIQAGFDIAQANGWNWKCLGVCAIHGETDQQFADTGYAAEVLEWQFDYAGDIAAISGQDRLTFYASQQAGYAPDLNALSSSTALQLFYAYGLGAGTVIIPAALFPVDHIDGLHLINQGQRWLGGQFARAIHYTYANPEAFDYPILVPKGWTRENEIIFLDFEPMNAPLILDVTNIMFQENYGFFYKDSTDSAVISSVELESATRVKITLSGIPTGANKTIVYGTANPLETETWPKFGGGRGNLRDSYTGTSVFGLTLHNWAPAFIRTEP